MNGTVAVRGMALANAYLIFEQDKAQGPWHVEQVDLELERLQTAVETCTSDLAALIERLQRETDAEHAEILDFQILLLEDDNYIGRIKRTVQAEEVNCEYAVSKCSEAYRTELSALDNPYLNERTADITDIEQRLLRVLSHKADSCSLSGPQIVAAVDLTPSQVVELGRNELKGIVLEKGGLSSHCVILARSMNIPCIIGMDGILGQLQEGQLVLLDAEHGEVIPSPGEDRVREYEKYQAAAREEREALERYRVAKTASADGRPMKVYANITSEVEVKALLDQGGEGVGLLRTEMLYMERTAPPDEAFQYDTYAKIVKGLGGRPLIVRTLDVGGDKHIPYLNIPEEENPFLGYRAIRYCLDHPDVFRVQIAAILRAAQYGPVQLMLPMIATVAEVEQARGEIEAVKADLESRNIGAGEVTLGMMVETPAAAVMADQFARSVDFFSIGTNDLTQYLFAADRNNAKVASLNSYFQPALLRMIDHVCRSAHQSGIEVDICGQAGEVDELIPLWVGMGVDNLSVSIPSIARVRRTISRCDSMGCRALVKQALQFHTDDEVKKLMREEVAKWS